MGYMSDKIDEIYDEVVGSGTDIEKEILKYYEFRKQYYSGRGDVITGLHIMDAYKENILRMSYNNKEEK